MRKEKNKLFPFSGQPNNSIQPNPNQTKIPKLERKSNQNKKRKYHNNDQNRTNPLIKTKHNSMNNYP